MTWQKRATAYQMYVAFLPVWNWTFAVTVPAGGSLESPRVFTDVPPTTGPTDEYEPHRYTLAAVARVTSGNAYYYLAFKQAGSVERRYKVFGASVNVVTYFGAGELERIPQVDEWYVKIIERTGTGPADCEGTFTLYARGFNFG